MDFALTALLQKHSSSFHPIVPFNQSADRIFDLALDSSELTTSIVADVNLFTNWINAIRKEKNAQYLIGGYKENRTLVYAASKLFDSEEARTLHLGIDIWGEEGTPIFAPLGGMIHSFAHNNNYGDYGATIILQHQLETISFYTLYGHLSLADIASLRVGQFITRGNCFAHLGNAAENGQWPPHLHFQVIIDIGQYQGDYPGVCKLSEAKTYLNNSPDPSPLIHLF